MSTDMSSERVCYVQCNYCNTLLAVGVPNGVLSMVTVRCGHCTNLLSVNMGALSSHPQPLPLQKQQHHSTSAANSHIGSSSSTTRETSEQPRMPPIRPPEKRQRVPSAYNRFIKEEIQRIKSSNPQISHREAFSAAAKNWAHFPNIHFGVKLHEANKQAAANANIAGGGDATHKSRGFY